MIWARLRLWFWEWRLRAARGFRHDLEATITRERRWAQAEVEFCQARVARARISIVEKNADRAHAMSQQDRSIEFP